MKQILFNQYVPCQIGDQNYSYNSSNYFAFYLNMWSIGDENNPSSFYFNITLKKPSGEAIFESSGELKKQQLNLFLDAPKPMPQPTYVPAPDPSTSINDSLSKMLEIFDKAIGVKKDSGVWVPKFNSGDTLIVDKPGSSEIKVMDVEDQSFEKIPKKAMIIQSDVCTCPMRQIITHGCPRLKGGKCAE